MYMKSLLHKVISFLFPHYCLGCKVNGPSICNKCLLTIPPPERDLPRGIYALYDYRDPLIKKALWNLKYGNIPELATIVAPQMYETILEILSEEYALLEAKNIIIIPIPTSGDKSKKRTYNHAYKIAQAVVEYQNKITNQPAHPSPALPLAGRGNQLQVSRRKWLLLNPLIKIKKTERQALVKGRDKRMKNIKGAYGIKKHFLSPGAEHLGYSQFSRCSAPGNLENAFFIIIDDITTTGASINEAMRALKPLKPRHVFGITIAH